MGAYGGGSGSRAKRRSRERAKGAVVKGTGAVIRSGVSWWLMAAGPIERNFIPHSTTLARGRMSGNRLGGVAGYGLGRFWFGANARVAFGGCVRLGIGISREAAKARRGPRGKADFDRIYMMDRI